MKTFMNVYKRLNFSRELRRHSRHRLVELAYHKHNLLFKKHEAIHAQKDQWSSSFRPHDLIKAEPKAYNELLLKI